MDQELPAEPDKKPQPPSDKSDGAFASMLRIALRAYQRGQYAEAAREYLAAVEGARAFGPNDSRFAAALVGLAETLRAQGRHTESEPLLLHALALLQEKPKETREQTARVRNSLAALYAAQGKWEKAEEQCRLAMEAAKAAGGNDPSFPAASLNNLAMLYKSQGKFDAALFLFQEALQIGLNSLGPRHPLVATTLNNLGAVCCSSGRYAEAEPLLRRSISIKEMASGASHPEIAAILNNLAECCWAERRYDEARCLYERVLAIDESTLGPEHTDIAVDLYLLGSAYEAEQEYDKAEPLYSRSARIRQKVLGANHPLTAKSLARLDHLRHLRNKTPRDKKASSPSSGRAPRSTPPRGRTSAQPSTPPNAATEAPPKASRKMIPIYPDVADSEKPGGRSGLQFRAQECEREGRLEEAERLYRQALSTKDLLEDSTTLFGGAALNNLALLLDTQDKREEAAHLLERSLAFWLERFGGKHPYVSTVLYNLAALCPEDRGQSDTATLCRRSLALARKS